MIKLHLKVFFKSIIVFTVISVIIRLFIMYPEDAFKVGVFTLIFGVIYYWVYVYQTEVG